MAECHIHDKPTMPCGNALVVGVVAVVALPAVVAPIHLYTYYSYTDCSYYSYYSYYTGTIKGIVAEHCGLVVYMAVSHEILAHRKAIEAINTAILIFLDFSVRIQFFTMTKCRFHVHY